MAWAGKTNCNRAKKSFEPLNKFEVLSFMNHQALFQKIASVLAKEKEVSLALHQCCATIAENLKAYDWVGFYFMNHVTQKLHLGPYVGDPTDHTVIDFGKGICGQVALSGETYLAADVNAESNYIACSINVRSEIVVPMFKGDQLIGQIDIDSHQVDRFGQEDEAFLKEVNQLIVEQLDGIEDYIQTLVK